MPESLKKYFVLFSYLALIVATFLVFGQLRHFDFINHDDNDYVYENQHVLKGLNWDNVVWAFTTNCASNWHPLTWLSLMFDCQLFGANSGKMHLVNLLFHMANTLALFEVLRKMTGSLWSSVFVAAAFALHPMHVESVAWITERKDVLSTLFFLLTLFAYLSYVRRPGLFRYFLTLLLFALGLLAKPMLVTLPFVLLLLDYWPLERIQTGKFSVSKLILEKVPFIVLSIISSVITFLVQLRGTAVIYIDAFPLKDRIANAFISYAIYIGKMFWPANLAIFHPFEVDNFVFLSAVIYVLLLLIISIFVVWFGRTQKYLPVGWFWYLVTLVPVIGFVQVGYQSFAERYTYIPYIGLFIIITWGLPLLLSRWPQRNIALVPSAVITLLILGISAYKQVGYWKNNFTLYPHAIEVTQNNFIAYNNLGVAFTNAGSYQEAVDAYKKSLAIKPDYEVYFNLGVACHKLGRWQEEEDAYKQCIKRKPDYAVAYLNLCITYNTLGRYQDAIAICKQAIKIKPDFAEAYYNLGFNYAALGNWPDAMNAWGQAVKIKPNYIDAHYNLGVAYLATGDKDSALEEYKILKNLNTEKANQLFKLINK